jgi:hypothetical protein
MPNGFVPETKGSAAFSEIYDPSTILAVANSTLFTTLFKIISPTIDYHEGYMARVPFPAKAPTENAAAITAIQLAMTNSQADEITFDFVAPLDWRHGPADEAKRQERLSVLEHQIDDEVYRLYSISDEDRAAIEEELGITNYELGMEEGRVSDEESAGNDDSPIVNRQSSFVNQEELAARWISYAVGIILGRFSPGSLEGLGRAVYRREDFAVGSLPAPDAAEFDALVGPAARFAYVDEDGGHGQSPGRHLFPRPTEAALRDLALPDGIAVLDPGHPRDLPALVERALALMLGDAAADEVIAAAAGPSSVAGARESARPSSDALRRFLSKEYYTKYHFSWYRKRPVYWPLQAAAGGYGIVVFHEKIGRDFLYILLADILEPKQRGVAAELADARGRAARAAGAARRAAEREATALGDQLRQLDDFARAVKRLADDGYRPAANWIDDGVILRLAPLHELIPLWKAEPKKHWDRLQRGDFDWSHIAMHYWPDRVREKCRTSKSFAIAHGL